jgi:20S proteasome alpha/beta subunit
LCLLGKDKAISLIWSDRTNGASSFNVYPDIKQISKSAGLIFTGTPSDRISIKSHVDNFLNEELYVYGTVSPVQRVLKSTATLVHERSMLKYARPYGIRVISMSYDTVDGTELLELDPLGSCHNCSAIAIGKNYHCSLIA